MPANVRTGNWIRPLREPQSEVTLFEDFVGSGSALPATFVNVDVQATGGTDWLLAQTGGPISANGWATATTGTGDNDTQAMFGALAWRADRATSDGLLIFEARINMPSVAGVGMSCGLTDAVTEASTLYKFVTTTWTTVPTDGVAWSYDTDATSPLFRGIGVKADTDTAAVVGSLPVNDTPVVYRIEVDAAGTAYFYENSIPIGAKANAVTITVPLAPFVEVSCKAGAAAKSGECDYVFVSSPR